MKQLALHLPYTVAQLVFFVFNALLEIPVKQFDPLFSPAAKGIM
jgi:hypothetical protein